MPTSGGETEKDPSGWTTDTLRALVDQRFSDERLRNEQRFQAQQEALGVALEQVRTETRALAVAMDKRFDGVNEFRSALTDREHRFMDRNESIQRHDSSQEKIAALDKRMTEGFAAINSRLDLSAGRGAGLEKGWLFLIGGVGLLSGLLAIAYAFN